MRRSSSARARPTRSRRWCSCTRPRRVIFDQALSPAQQRNLERHLGVAGRRPHEADPRHLRASARRATKASCRSSWRSCSTCRRGWCGAGPTSSASAAASAARRPGRGADRARPAHDRRAHQELKKQLEKVKRQRSTQRRARERNADVPRLARRLHQRRQVDAVQRARQAPRRTPPTSCSPRSTRRRASCTCAGVERIGRAVRHRRLHPRPAAQAGRGVPGDAAGGRRRRPAAARGRRRQPRAATSRWPRSQRVLAEIGAADVPQILVFNKIDRIEETERPRVLADMARAARRRARAARLRQRADAARASTLLRERDRRVRRRPAASGLNPAGRPHLRCRRSRRHAADDDDEAARDGTYHSHA